jgi:hypothetical protein
MAKVRLGPYWGSEGGGREYRAAGAVDPRSVRSSSVCAWDHGNMAMTSLGRERAAQRCWGSAKSLDLNVLNPEFTTWGVRSNVCIETVEMSYNTSDHSMRATCETSIQRRFYKEETHLCIPKGDQETIYAFALC